MLRLIEAWGVPKLLSGPHGPNEDFFQAATSVSICFGKGTYQTEDGPVECSLATCLNMSQHVSASFRVIESGHSMSSNRNGQEYGLGLEGDDYST